MNKTIINAAYKDHLRGLNFKMLREKYSVNRGYFEYHFKKLGYNIHRNNIKYIVNHNYFITSPNTA